LGARFRVKLLFAALSGLAFCAGCSKAQTAAVVSGAADSGGLGIRYAKHFSIEYMPDGVKLLSDYNERRCLLVPYGVEPPRVDYDLLARTPVSKAFYTSTTQVSFLDVLEDESLYDSVAAVTISREQWSIESVAERMRAGKTAYIAQNNSGTLDIEGLIALQPDMIFAEPEVMGAGNNLTQFEVAGLPYAVIGEWLEGETLASFEWIKFIAAFYNKDAEADAVFRRQEARLDELAALTADIPDDERPLAACGSVFNGVVYTQGGDSAVAREYRKAGGRYFLEEGTGGGALRLTPEEFFDKARGADILMYNSMILYTPDKKALLEESPLFAEFKSFKDDKIYVLARGYYMNGARIALKLEDAISIFQPELFSRDRRLTFYEKLPD
jgi:iron complex transport system substrate-binding protein